MSQHPSDPDNIEMEYSVHNGLHTHDGITVELSIYRIAGSDEGWILEVENQDGGSTVWDEPFETDDSAYSEFLAAIAKDGMAQFEFDDPMVH